MNSTWSNLLARRHLISELVKSELRTESSTAFLGWVWWLLDPLLMMLVYWGLLIGLLGRGKEQYAPYPIFVLGALITWKHFSASASKSIGTLKGKEGLIKAIPFPVMVLPISKILSGFVFFLFGFGVLIAAALVMPNTHASGRLWPLVQLPALMLAQCMLVTGICLPLACIGVLVKGVGGPIQHLLKVAFYLTPAVYGIDMVLASFTSQFGETLGKAAFSAYMLNPFAVIITGYRDCVFYGEFLDTWHWITLLIEAPLVLGIGYAIFRYYERRVIKFL